MPPAMAPLGPLNTKIQRQSGSRYTSESSDSSNGEHEYRSKWIVAKSTRKTEAHYSYTRGGES